MSQEKDTKQLTFSDILEYQKGKNLKVENILGKKLTFIKMESDKYSKNALIVTVILEKKKVTFFTVAKQLSKDLNRINDFIFENKVVNFVFEIEEFVSNSYKMYRVKE